MSLDEKEDGNLCHLAAQDKEGLVEPNGNASWVVWDGPPDCRRPYILRIIAKHPKGKARMLRMRKMTAVKVQGFGFWVLGFGFWGVEVNGS
jgi:hypothetical protein